MAKRFDTHEKRSLARCVGSCLRLRQEAGCEFKARVGCTVKLFLEIKHSSPVTPVIPVLGKVEAGRQEFKTTLATRRIQSYMRPWLKQTTNNQKEKKVPQTPLCLWILTPLPHTLGWRMLRLLPSPLPLTTARIKFFWLVPMHPLRGPRARTWGPFFTRHSHSCSCPHD